MKVLLTRKVILFYLMNLNLVFFAQVPQKINYQVIVRDSKGQLLIEEKIGVKISVLQVDTQLVYCETHVSKTNKNGLLSLEIGVGKNVFGFFQDINWAISPSYLKIEYDPSGGSNYLMTQINEFLSVPYALLSASSGNNTPGPQGVKGEKGDVGPIGPQGADGPPLNIQVSNLGDTLKFSNGNYVIIPGISRINKQVKDIDGNVYKAYSIGKQIWMAENLRVTKLNDGSIIPNISSPNEWVNTKSKAYCFFNNNNQNISNYGLLYNYYAISSKLCPSGWHVPSDSDWNMLIDYLGGELNAGTKLKEIGTTFWKSPNLGVTNSSLFSGVGGGRRSEVDGSDGFLNEIGFWWSSTINSSNKIWVRTLKSSDTKVEKIQSENTGGYSVRCLKD